MHQTLKDQENTFRHFTRTKSNGVKILGGDFNEV